MGNKKIYIIGTGLSAEDISSYALKIISRAEVLIGGKRQLGYFNGHRGIGIELKSNINNLAGKIKKKYDNKKTVVLASGDPNFFGIASTFYKAFPKNRIEIIPNITAFQGAFARIKEPWDNAAFISIHGKALSNLNRAAREQGTFVIYCDGTNNPAAAARYILAQNPDMKKAKAWVFQNMGSSEEKMASGSLEKFIKIKTAPLSMMIIKNSLAPVSIPYGIPDSRIKHQRGMITKKDIRLMVLARLQLSKRGVFWDIGAGSGSVSIEAANLYPGLEIYAIEKNEKRYEELLKNIRIFKAFSVEPVYAKAPDILSDLPSPDSVFIGGTGGELQAIMSIVRKRLGSEGNMVINCVTMETLSGVLQLLKRWRWHYEVAAAQHSYMSCNSCPEIFRADNQVFIVHGCKAAKAQRRKV